MVELREAEYRAGGSVILHPTTTRFREGRFNVILGPNGAGKTTLLRLASGLLRPSRGAVLYGDRSLREMPPERLARERAVLSQHVELAFPLPARDVVLMGRYPHYGRAPGRRDLEIVARALEMVGMTEKRDQPYPTLSGGEKQKVQLARVLAQIWTFDEPGPAPRLLFLDEPTSSLDVHYQLHLLELARSLLSHACTVVAVLHDLNTALHFGDAFFVLEGGRIVREADAAEEIDAALVERVFRVRARRVEDPAGESLWTFAL